MSGAVATPTKESHAIALLAGALWGTIRSAVVTHSTHYLEICLPQSAIAVFEKTEIAGMHDEYLDKCAAEQERLLVLVITAMEEDGAEFFAIMLPMDEPAATPSAAHPVLQ